MRLMRRVEVCCILFLRAEMSKDVSPNRQIGSFEFAGPRTPAQRPAVGLGQIQVVNQNEATAPLSTGIGDDRQGQGEEEKAAQIDSRADGMGTAMQIAQPVESLQRERQAGQQPDDEQAALVVVADMLQSITIVSIVEAFIFNMPSTLGDATRREVGEPVSLDDIAIRFVLAIAEDTHRFPLQALPRIKVVGVPDLHAIGNVLGIPGPAVGNGSASPRCRVIRADSPAAGRLGANPPFRSMEERGCGNSPSTTT